MLKTAISHHQAGRLAEAKQLYAEVLAQESRNFVAMHLLGVIALQEGDTDQAIERIAQSLEIRPNYAEAHYHMGRALKTAGKPIDAVASYQQAIALKPDYVQALTGLGDTYVALGQWDEAVTTYRRAIAVLPEYPEAHNNLGIALKAQGQLDEALASHEKAVALKPDYAEAHYNVGNILLTQEKLEDAAASFQKALEIRPDYAAALSNLGNAYKRLGKRDEAVARYREALAAAPDYAVAHNNLGVVFEETGALADAAAQYRKAVAADPDYAEAYRHLARIESHAEGDAAIEAMERVYEKPGLDDAQRMHLAFGLGKAYEDARAYQKAFDCYAQGNALKRAQYSYSIDGDADLFARLKQVFDAPMIAGYAGAGCPDETPIFVLGMPRSGTTLVEQILASHPAVHGAGELQVFPRLVSARFGQSNGEAFPERVRHAAAADFDQLGAAYVNEIRRLDGAARFVTDKLPSNFINIGLIKLALPNAKIIHCVRNPADNGFSIFKSYFTAAGLPFAYELNEIGRYYALYADLMAHWQNVFPDGLYSVRYEDLVADLAGETRRLLEHCGLDWHDAVLDFHKTERPVSTASAEQVRRPIYTSSIDAWKPFETQLAPMLAQLKSQL